MKSRREHNQESGRPHKRANTSHVEVTRSPSELIPHLDRFRDMYIAEYPLCDYLGMNEILKLKQTSKQWCAFFSSNHTALWYHLIVHEFPESKPHLDALRSRFATHYPSYFINLECVFKNLLKTRHRAILEVVRVYIFDEFYFTPENYPNVLLLSLGIGAPEMPDFPSDEVYEWTQLSIIFHRHDVLEKMDEDPANLTASHLELCAAASNMQGFDMIYDPLETKTDTHLDLLNAAAVSSVEMYHYIKNKLQVTPTERTLSAIATSGNAELFKKEYKVVNSLPSDILFDAVESGNVLMVQLLVEYYEQNPEINHLYAAINNNNQTMTNYFLDVCKLKPSSIFLSRFMETARPNMRANLQAHGVTPIEVDVAFLSHVAIYGNFTLLKDCLENLKDQLAEGDPMALDEAAEDEIAVADEDPVPPLLVEEGDIADLGQEEAYSDEDDIGSDAEEPVTFKNLVLNAIASGNEKKIYYLIEQGKVTIDAKILHHAISCNLIDIVKYLLTLKPELFDSIQYVDAYQYKLVDYFLNPAYQTGRVNFEVSGDEAQYNVRRFLASSDFVEGCSELSLNIPSAAITFRESFDAAPRQFFLYATHAYMNPARYQIPNDLMPQFYEIVKSIFLEYPLDSQQETLTIKGYLKALVAKLQQVERHDEANAFIHDLNLHDDIEKEPSITARL